VCAKKTRWKCVVFVLIRNTSFNHMQRNLLLLLGLAVAIASASHCSASTQCNSVTDIQVEPLTGTLGAIVHGVNISNSDIAPETMLAIHTALLQYKVLFFRDQYINPTQQVSFARYFGKS
jgi:hypothetical protein